MAEPEIAAAKTVLNNRRNERCLVIHRDAQRDFVNDVVIIPQPYELERLARCGFLALNDLELAPQFLQHVLEGFEIRHAGDAPADRVEVFDIALDDYEARKGLIA